ncbi:hypothetical protein GSI_04654 [Ganoderma sinense ZZ0214-1]|uniref:Aminoglycoside phosphotransferase domain-containing protein n=1 Tax=Ganoderma sinense ZZ0214-1 TaxID=1077348 RepID=A0A2G8SHF2_9APHY|nr:hypothetical protein GSI_04654 [Ganoderma sinense ZZ0214-1]
MACTKRFCMLHINPCPEHECPTFETDEKSVNEAANRALEAELASIARRVQLSALTERAAALRGGIACSAPDLSMEALSGMNIHLTLRFDDGVDEAATLTFLSTKTSVPVPRVYDVSLPSQPNDVGVGYILMEKLEGTAMDWTELRLDAQAQTKVLEQFADIFASLSQHAFPLIGCLQSCDPTVVGPLVSENAADVIDGTTRCIGPFKSTADYLTAVVDVAIDHILQRESQVQDPVGPYLALREVQNSVRLSLPEAVRRAPAEFFLRHMDDKGDQVLLDAAHNIVGIIDWEWAQTLPKEHAFAAPLFMVDVGSYYDGIDGLSDAEAQFADILERKGHAGLAECVRAGRASHRLAHAVDEGSAPDDVKVHLRSFRRLVQKVDEEWETWEARAMSLKGLKHDRDPGLRKLLDWQKA